LTFSLRDGKFSGKDGSIMNIEIFPAIIRERLKIDNKPIIEKYTLEMMENNFCAICIPIV
jgi:DNA gyrase inhibitor GyrI